MEAEQYSQWRGEESAVMEQTRGTARWGNKKMIEKWRNKQVPCAEKTVLTQSQWQKKANGQEHSNGAQGCNPHPQRSMVTREKSRETKEEIR